MPAVVKPKLLVVELWGVGDLAIATPFLRAASERCEVTLLAKPHALELQPRLWPGIRVEPWTAPWTAFKGKYQLWRWPWKELFALRRKLTTEHFEQGVSARPDPRDHLLLEVLNVKNRLGFPRMGSSLFLTHPLDLPKASEHRYEFWRIVAKHLGVNLPSRQELVSVQNNNSSILVHTGAAQPVRVWPLENYSKLVCQLRLAGFSVSVICDPGQRGWWLQHGEPDVKSPAGLVELMDILDNGGVFIGNDSGPGHLAAVMGLRTFTIFGPQLPQRFIPLHPKAEWVEGDSCPFKPCKDYCRFPTPFCIENLSSESVTQKVFTFLQALSGREDNSFDQE